MLITIMLRAADAIILMVDVCCMAQALDRFSFGVKVVLLLRSSSYSRLQEVDSVSQLRA